MAVVAGGRRAPVVGGAVENCHDDVYRRHHGQWWLVVGGVVNNRHSDNAYHHHRHGWRSWPVVGGGPVEGGVVENCYNDAYHRHCHGRQWWPVVGGCWWWERQ